MADHDQINSGQVFEFNPGGRICAGPINLNGLHLLDQIGSVNLLTPLCCIRDVL